MSWIVPLALAGLAVMLMAASTFVAARRRHRVQTVAPAQTVGPRVLVHDINDDRCTGCDACVAVCPTNVLDLIANKSRVLRFQDCIQCEACMFACPTDALVMYPQGGTPPPLEVPELDEYFQTVVPGQYLIGEVAGKPLVKNAANLGRVVVEHMLTSGLRSGAIGHGQNVVDVAIVGSGPAGLSAALTCIQRGLSYVVIEKEQVIASTIARYPKGKLVMAEPYGTENVSLLPVFDASKEQLIPIWHEIISRVGLVQRLGESVETIVRAADGTFELRTTVATYRAQRVVLAIGTRGKPRTLQVPGENMPKIRSLLEDPDEWRGQWVLVVGGGDSACEAALALADAGAMVILSYRGKSFARAAPRNKQSIEQYAAEGRVRVQLGSQVLGFDAETVTLALADGTQQRYRNDAAFVLIGADPPVAWLERVGIRTVQRPHGFQLGRTDDLVRRVVRAAAPCPEDAPRAVAQILGLPMPAAPAFTPMPAMPPPVPLATPQPAAPRKWLQSATNVFATRLNKSRPPEPPPPTPTQMFVPGSTMMLHINRDGRRDSLAPQERTRILRMLRDDGGRQADDDAAEGVHIGSIPMMVPARPMPPPPPPPRSSAPRTIAPRPQEPITDVEEQVHIGAMPPQPAARARFLDTATEISQPPSGMRRWPDEAPSTEPGARYDHHDDAPSEAATIMMPRDDE